MQLPGAFGNLAVLQVLRIDQNQLTSLPASFGQLTRLQHLRMDQNQLTSLPESFGQLAALRILRMEKNRLTSLPESMVMLRLDSFTLDRALMSYTIREYPDTWVTGIASVTWL